MSLHERIAAKALEAHAPALSAWIGAGLEPVEPEQAQNRASVCLRGCNGGKCPYNFQGQWSFKQEVADVIHAWAQAKTAIKLSVEGEEGLGTCEVCKCRLSLKVWTPFQHIFSTTSDEKFSEFPAWCWQQIELKEHTKT